MKNAFIKQLFTVALPTVIVSVLLIVSPFPARGQTPPPDPSTPLSQGDTLRTQPVQAPLEYNISGIVKDEATGKPIAFVNVGSAGGSHFTVTNQDGYFVLKTPSPIQEITLSHIGYVSLSRRISEEDYLSDKALNLRMQSAPLTLQEAIVYAQDPYVILGRAIDNIEDNYPRNGELMETFYRESIRKRSKYIYISEAVSHMYKSSYRDGDAWRDRVAVQKGRLLVSPRPTDTLSVKVVGGPTQCVTLDVVKDRGFLLNEEELSNYTLEMDLPISIGNRVQYAVRLRPRVNCEYALHNGVIYIDKETYAISRVELSLDMSDKDKATRMILIRKPRGLKFNPRELSITISYSPSEDGKYRLSYLRTTIRFDADWKRVLLKTHVTAVNEMAVTHLFPPEQTVVPSRKESFNSRSSLSDKVELYEDPLFWKDYNIIEPTESLEKAIGKLLKTNR